MDLGVVSLSCAICMSYLCRAYYQMYHRPFLRATNNVSYNRRLYIQNVPLLGPVGKRVFAHFSPTYVIVIKELFNY